MVLLPHKGGSNDIRHCWDGIVRNSQVVDSNIVNTRVIGRTFAGTRVVAI